MTVTERVMRILNGESVEESREVEKSVGKYISKKMVNGKWVYKYHPDRPTARKHIDYCTSRPLRCTKKNALQIGEQFIKNWQLDWQKNPLKSRCSIFGGKVVVVVAIDVNGEEGISLKHFGYKGCGKKRRRSENEIFSRAVLLPYAKEMLESKKKCAINEVRKSKDMTEYEILGKAKINNKDVNVCVIVSKRKNDVRTYLSIMKKAISEDMAFITDVFLAETPENASFWAKLEGGGTLPQPTGSLTPINKLVNRNIEIKINDITEGNRIAKFAQLKKCLAGGTPEYIPADNTKALPCVNIRIKDFSSERIEKALRTMAMSFDIPLKAAKGEVFLYKAQEDLTDKWCMFFSELVSSTYGFITDYFDLPKRTVMSKAVLTHKGKVLYNPETGEPIKQSDWDKFVRNLEKFLNRNIKDSEKKIILQSHSLGKILNRMLKYNTLEAVKELQLEKLKYHGKSFDWISESVKNMKNTFGTSFTRQEQARIEMLTQSAAIKVTNITDKMRADIKQILIDGVKGRKSKSEVSQALFDKMVGDNRDFQRLADTEIQNAVNNSFLREEVQNTAEGQKAYFQRLEVVDNNTCKYCKQMNGKIAVWSDKPLKNEKADDVIADFVIWEGKEWNGSGHSFTTGVFHPYCRGTWVRYDTDIDNARIDALVAEQSGRAKKWNDAVKQAKEEYKKNGIANPDDTTQGFTERINELFRSEDIQKSLSINDKLFNLWTRRLSPEFAKEYKKLCDDAGGFIPRKIYSIKGYPKGQDLENCILLELRGDFFVISCGGDWQNEKLVKIMLSKKGLVAKVISVAAKEDKRLLRRKNNYILNEVNHLATSKKLYGTTKDGYTYDLNNPTEKFYFDLKNAFDKSLTYSGHKLQGRTAFAGLKISIENKKGSIRRGVDSDGHKWAIKMKYDYGYIRETEGVDGDHVDCYLGDNENARNVYIIHQKIPGTDTYDEDKCMLGFNTLEEAKRAYFSQYDKSGFFGGVDTVPIEVFKEKVRLKKWRGKKLEGL